MEKKEDLSFSWSGRLGQRVMGYVNGRWVQREESGVGREEEEEWKKKKKKKDGMSRKRQDTDMSPTI